MSETVAPIEIPNRALFKAAEVCDLLKMQPYVLRSWEAEFPTLGVSKVAGGPRVYRRADVEQVLRIRHLLLVDGLTLAGARRKLEEDATFVTTVDGAAIDKLIGRNVRERLGEVKRGLRSLLDLLGGASFAEFTLAPTPSKASHGRRAATLRNKSARGRPAPPRPATPARRKRSA